MSTKTPIPAERHPALLSRSSTILAVVDMQQPFLNAIHGRDALVANVRLLCRAAFVLGVPIVVTEQNRARMGGTIAAITEAIGLEAMIAPPLDKMCFSAFGAEGFRQALAARPERRDVLVCGLETHICVSQTAYDLLNAGYRVHVAADAVSSRTLERHKLGMERIRDGGALPCCAEAAVYEWMATAAAAEFKEILALVR
jgi:nicotinamidase-related amidase